MGGLLRSGDQLQCPHGGHVRDLKFSTRVRIEGQPLVLGPFQSPIVGCPAPDPCRSVSWVTVSPRLRIDGQPVVSSTDYSLAEPTGSPVTAASFSTRVGVH